MEFEQRVIIRLLYWESAEARDIQIRLSAQFGNAACNLRSVQRWCLYVQQEREFLNDEARSGMPPIAFLAIQILSSLEILHFHSAY
jgi:hypothetical protein